MTDEELSGRDQRLQWTIELIGRALDDGYGLSVIFPTPADATPQMIEIIEKRKSLLSIARYEFRTTLKHDIQALRDRAFPNQQSPSPSPGTNIPKMD